MKRLFLFLAASIVVSLLALGASRGLGYGWAVTVLRAVISIDLSLAAVCFVFGLVTGDYSWVDRIWSIAPVLFAWIYAGASRLSPRPTLAAALVTLWGARLTFNFARRGGYAGAEDYRWAVLRDRIPQPVAWQLFNLLFISLFQLAVLALFTSPLGRIASAPDRNVSPLFALAALLPLAFLAYETAADSQQWRFQQAKAAYREALSRGEAPEDPTGDLGRGFRTTGLFALSRHPNYFGELGFWWSVYLLGCVDGRLAHWTMAGALALSAVFVGSTGFTEAISAAKYPDYRRYRTSTSALVPWFRKAAPEAAAPD
ncbi:MAG TPA: DUF1295 domain-containing protein [Rectinemataceae bacterium]|nr:DUF1295 domain-containing protein [Rectinemataceae bacterium]